MKSFVVVAVMVALVAVGCGANKSYVDGQIKLSESRTSAQLAALNDKTDTNAAEVSKLKSLANELSNKADMAINKAKGFETYQIIWSGQINFKYDSWEIAEAAEQTLMDAGEKMEQHPGSIIEASGHADRTGSRKYNVMLGEKRANSVKRFLAERFGVSLYRMFTISYGEDKPIAMPDEKQAASKNRRVDLKIWGEL